jgi:hypothetical protein
MIKHSIKVKALNLNFISVIHILFQLNIPRVKPNLLREILSPHVRKSVSLIFLNKGDLTYFSTLRLKKYEKNAK